MSEIRHTRRFQNGPCVAACEGCEFEQTEKQAEVKEPEPCSHMVLTLRADGSYKCPVCGVKVINEDVADQVHDRVWLVWSNQHKAWWNPNSCGYTMEVKEAGRYTLAEAIDKCEMRSKRKDLIPPEVAVPSPEWIEKLSKPTA